VIRRRIDRDVGKDGAAFCFDQICRLVVIGLVYDFKTWMPGTRPDMTADG